jgi:hypothetical protein
MIGRWNDPSTRALFGDAPHPVKECARSTADRAKERLEHVVTTWGVCAAAKVMQRRGKDRLSDESAQIERHGCTRTGPLADRSEAASRLRQGATLVHRALRLLEKRAL